MSGHRWGHDKAILHTVRESIGSLLGVKDETSAEERLLKERDRVQVKWRKHRNAYVGIMGSLMLLTVFISLEMGELFPVFPIMGSIWGAFLVTHFLNTRSWMKENDKAVQRAERVLGLSEGRAVKEPAKKAVKQPQTPDVAVVVQGVTIEDPTWLDLLERGRSTVERAQAAMTNAGGSQSSIQLSDQLEASLEDLNRLAAGAERIRRALQEIAPEGMSSLDRDIETLDDRISRISDAGLKETYLANRSLLLARRAKVDELHIEQARMVATAEGFLLAADNLRLDAARIGAGAPQTAKSALKGPANRLAEEVDILRRVEAELERF